MAEPAARELSLSGGREELSGRGQAKARDRSSEETLGNPWVPFQGAFKGDIGPSWAILEYGCRIKLSRLIHIWVVVKIMVSYGSPKY